MRPILLTLALLLGSAAAAPAAYAPPAGPHPKLGTWTLVGVPGKGSFRLVQGTGKHRDSFYAERITGTSAPSAAGCAEKAQKIVVGGRLKLRTFTSGGYTSWGVGKQNPKAKNEINDTPVTVVVGGKRMTGGFSLVWDYANTKQIIRGSLVAGTCHTYFTEGHKAK